MKTRPVIVLAALGIAACAGAWAAFATQEEAPAPALAPVTRGDIEIAVTAQGTVKPLNYVDVGAQVSGQLRQLLVKEGDVVTQGQLLAVIDPTVYTAQVEASRADLLGLQAQLAEKKAQLRLYEQQFDRQARLLKDNATSRDAYESAAASRDMATAQIARLEAEIAKAKSTLEGDEANLGYTQIRAPMAGTVMSLTARQGQTLNANQSAPTILQIADLDTMTVSAQVNEADVSRLSVGMAVYFTTLGQSERRWTSTLRQVMPTPEEVNNVILYNALFDVANPDKALMSKMTAQVFFRVSHAANALQVPVAAVRGDRDGAKVTVFKDGRSEERAVRTGIRNRIAVEILDGLSEGEQVVVAPSAAGGSATRRPPGFGARL